MKKTHLLATAGVLLLAVACGARIWAVNHSETYEKYKVTKQVYGEGTEVALTNTSYYVDQADLSGYSIKVTDAAITETADFLDEYGLAVEDLPELGPDNSSEFENYGMIYLVTAEFKNENWEEPSDAYILLSNFLLVGLDYWVPPAVDSINWISGFNPELGGSSAFAIGSDRVFSVTIPYLIDTEGDHALTLEYLLEDPPRLLITVYPTESYLELPQAEIL